MGQARECLHESASTGRTAGHGVGAATTVMSRAARVSRASPREVETRPRTSAAGFGRVLRLWRQIENLATTTVHSLTYSNRRRWRWARCKFAWLLFSGTCRCNPRVSVKSPSVFTGLGHGCFRTPQRGFSLAMAPSLARGTDTMAPAWTLFASLEQPLTTRSRTLSALLSCGIYLARRSLELRRRLESCDCRNLFSESAQSATAECATRKPNGHQAQSLEVIWGSRRIRG